MAYGVEQQIGIGAAQVLPQGPSHMPLAQQLYRQKQDREEKARQEKKDRDLDEYNRIKIVGDALDPRNFNQLVHTKVRDATAELAAKLKDKPSLADTYLMAQQQAGKLGHMSDQFNKLQQQLATTRDEYKANKRLNTNAIAEKALGNALRDFNEKGEVDLTKNYYDEALNSNPRLALKGGTGFIPKIDPDELVEYESEGEERQGRGGGSRFKWKVKNFPSFYDVKDKGKFEAPEVTTKGVPIRVGDKQEMALSEEAYQRYIVDPADALALDIAIKDKYGDDFDVNTEQGEILRRVEAYKNADRFKPQPKVSDRQFENRPPSTSNFFNFGGGSGAAGATQGNAFDDMKDASYGNFDVKGGYFYNKDGTPYGAGEAKRVFITGSELPTSIRTALNAGGIKPEMLTKGVDAEVKDGVIQSISNKKIGTVTRAAMEGVYQPKADTEPMKGRKLQFAQPAVPKPQSGYTNQQAATYKGKKITAGIKNGKWYNVQTGEEIK